jgi:ABC-type nickel/cobalt efflux system permease component RcnA
VCGRYRHLPPRYHTHQAQRERHRHRSGMHERGTDADTHHCIRRGLLSGLVPVCASVMCVLIMCVFLICVPMCVHTGGVVCGLCVPSVSVSAYVTLMHWLGNTPPIHTPITHKVRETQKMQAEK